MESDVSQFLSFWKNELRFVRCRKASPSEIIELKKQLGVSSLPASYEAFLLVAGKGCGDLWAGSDMFLPPRFNFRLAANELLAENEIDLFLKADDVVIGMHQGYQFLYLAGSGDDPPVFRWSEGKAEPVQVAESFTALVTESLAFHS